METYCRLCPKMFCCKKCRLKHEKSKHNLENDCNICIYGYIHWRYSNNNKDNELFAHIQIHHMPLQCLKCKQTFTRISKLLQNHKCEILKEAIEPIADASKSIYISGNNVHPLTPNGHLIQNSSMPILKTSTPMVGADPNINMNFPVVIISPPEGRLSSEDVKHIQKLTPINYSDNYQMPLVTPLRSIIVKNKSHGNTSERRVTFSDMTEEVSSKNERPKFFFDSPDKWEEYRSSKQRSSYFPEPPDLIPSTPITDQSDMFFTPDGPSNWNGDLETPEIEKENKETPLAGLNKWFGTLAKVVTDVVKSVFHTDENDDCKPLQYTTTSGSVKRFLSPNADRTVPKNKRLCIRGRRPISHN